MILLLTTTTLALTLAVGPDITARDRLVKDLPNGVFAGKKLVPKVAISGLQLRVQSLCPGDGEDRDTDATLDTIHRSGLLLRRVLHVRDDESGVERLSLRLGPRPVGRGTEPPPPLLYRLDPGGDPPQQRRGEVHVQAGRSPQSHRQHCLRHRRAHQVCLRS